MEVIGGSCRFGLWHVHVWWSGKTIHRVRFATSGIAGEMPALIKQYCAGKPVSLVPLLSVAITQDTMFGRIYRIVREVPYGRTATYGEIATRAGTSPRVVGQAMAHNPTPLVIPCHRIVSAHGLGGYSSPLEIKEALLAMERKGLRKALR